MSPFGQCHSLDSVTLWIVSLWVVLRIGQCHSLDSVTLWAVSLFGQCHSLDSVTLWTVSFFGQLYCVLCHLSQTLECFPCCYCRHQSLITKTPSSWDLRVAVGNSNSLPFSVLYGEGRFKVGNHPHLPACSSTSSAPFSRLPACSGTNNVGVLKGMFSEFH